MGRHSAADDDDRVVMTFAAPAAGAPPRLARHARPDEAEELAEQDTVRRSLPDEAPPPAPFSAAANGPAPPAGAEPVAPPVVSQPVPPPPKAGKDHQSTTADIALLREHSDVRARVIAAVIAPFVLYSVVMYLGRWMHMYFIWVWIPLVTAGVLAGSLLDVAHRRYNKRAP
jgi:hypothetical protein